jgi:hypothetical protein
MAAPSQIRKHLMVAHGGAEFDPAATDATLEEFHAWDHETGEVGPPHDPDNLSGKKRWPKGEWPEKRR